MQRNFSLNLIYEKGKLEDFSPNHLQKEKKNPRRDSTDGKGSFRKNQEESSYLVLLREILKNNFQTLLQQFYPKHFSQSVKLLPLLLSTTIL